MKKPSIITTVYLFTLLAVLTRCEDNIVEPPAQRNNRILEYKIVNVPEAPIMGSVNDLDTTITLYLPYYYYLIVLVPEIKVPEGATLTPESGTLVENLMDYFENGRDIRYTVTAKDGSQAVYRLQIVVQQPAFTVDELSPSSDAPARYVHTPDPDPFTLRWHGQTTMFSNAEINKSIIRVTLESDNGMQYTFGNTNADAGIEPQFTEDLARYYLPADTKRLPAGNYTVTVRFYSRSITLKNLIRIEEQ